MEYKLLSMLKSDLKQFYYIHFKHMTPREIRQNYLRKIGMVIGEECYIFSKDIETSEPFLVTLGDHVTISTHVKFSTHDASAHFYDDSTSDIYGRITIGNNVFIGMGAIILPGVTIANHCIIGAGAVVAKSFLEEGSVIAGNPARVISTVEKLKLKNSDKKLMTYGMSYEEMKEYLLNNENQFRVT